MPHKWLILWAFAEELVFRFSIQETLLGSRKMSRSIGPLSLANVVTSLLFSAAHLVHNSPLQSALVFFPSLVFGFCWERYRSLLAVALLHYFYNFCLFYRQQIEAILF